MRATPVALLLLLPALAGCLAVPGATERASDADPTPFPSFPPGVAVGETRLFTRIGDPGYPEGIALDGDRLYVSSVAPGVPAGIVLVYDLATGDLLGTIAFDPPSEQRGPSFGSGGMALDAAGRLYVTELVGARIVRIDPHATDLGQVTYAEIPDLPPCLLAAREPCAPTRQARAPGPNDPAFGPDGALYVSDSYQHTIFRIPPGGGSAEIWFQDARFEAAGFGMNGIAFSPGDEHLYIAQTVVAPVVPRPDGWFVSPAGAVWRLPFADNPSPADLELFHAYPGGAPDGIAFDASGRLYVTIIDAGLAGHGISVLAPDGTEEAFFPSAAANEALEIPYHGPASLVFHDAHRSLLVTNLAQTNPDNWAVLESFVGEVGLPLHRPEVP